MDKSIKWYPTVRSMASAPWTTRFWPYYTLDWLGKLLLTNMILQKTDELPKRFGLLHCCDQNAKWAVFQCITLTFYRFLFLFYWNKFNLFAVPETTAQGKAPIRASKPTKWSPAVISTTFSPCTPRFWPYYMLDWLGKVAVTNKVNGKLIKYQSGSASFTVVIKMRNGGSFIYDILPLIEFYWFIGTNSMSLLVMCDRSD